MFGSLFSKASEVFGKAFIVSSFIPCLFVFAWVWYSISPSDFSEALTTWTRDKTGIQLSKAALVLVGEYIAAYVIYGLREQLIDFFRRGHFWVFPRLKELRRRRFINRRRSDEARTDEIMATLQASAWAEIGFNLPLPAKVYLPPWSSARQFRNSLDHFLPEIQRLSVDSGFPSTLNPRLEALFSLLLLAAHRLAAADEEMFVSIYLPKLKGLDNPSGTVKSWCRRLQQDSYQSVNAALAPLSRHPPAEYTEPTAFGNALAWMSRYTYKRYGVEIEYLLPRLTKVIEKEYADLIAERKMFFDFSVAMSFLLSLATFILFPYGIYQICGLFKNAFLDNLLPAVFCLTPSLAACVAAVLFYRSSISSAGSYGMMINSAVDLFRLSLINVLKIQEPSIADEPVLWDQLNSWFADAKRPTDIVELVSKP